MKLTVVGMVKNSADIIETFIRGNGLYADNFVLIDNCSTDNTVNILNSLRKEGYDIEIIRDNENAYLQSMKMNILIQQVTRSGSSDWIIPLDDDEILFSDSGKNVRDIISSWDPAYAYFAPWRIFIPTEEDNFDEVCVAKRQKYIFDESLAIEKKIIFSNSTASNSDFRIVQGNHDFIGSESTVKLNQNELIIAHYPVRSEAQIVSKALVGWTNYLAMPNNSQNNGGHWKKIYDMYKSTMHVSIDMMWQICMLYLKPDFNTDDLQVNLKPLLIDEKAFEIKYTSIDEINPIMNYINNTEVLATNYARLLENNMK